METIEAEDRDAHPDLLRRVRGKTVAVDLSIWIFEATSQRELAEIFTPAGQVAKVVFERACNFLRHGVVPVGVLDGVPPPEKLRRLGLLTAAGAGGGEFKKLGEVARKVLAALGLCAVAAPGEAEATCAALNARGLVDACATGDGDALLFGATTVFKTLKLYADNPELSRLERCESAWIGDALELDEDTRRRAEGASGASESNAEDENAARAPHRYPGDPGDPGDGSVMEGDAHGSLGVVADALVALATLAGGDYDVGADRVGPTLAARVVRRLAAEARAERAAAPAAFPGGRDRSGGGGGGGGGVSGLERDPLESESGVRPNRALDMPMCERLDAFLRLPPDDALAALTQCTGCATCKHDGGGASRKKKCVRGCIACGVAKGEPCVARPDAPCECAFHARTLERWADKARRRARVTEGFAAASRRAAVAYAKQASRAAAAVASLSRAELAWRARPDVPELGRLMLLYCQIPEPRVREKLLPLLLEWDLSRAAPGAAQFAAAAIKKMAGAKGAAPWRFLLEVDAADPRERAVAARARERAREVRKANKVAEASRPSAGSDEPSSDFSDSASEGPGPAPSAADDDDRPQIEKDLAYFAAKPQTRAVRAELVRAALPELVARFERGGSASTPAKDAEARAAGSARATPRGVPKTRAADQRSILGFVTPRKDAEAAPSSRAHIHGGLSSKGKEPAAFATPPATPTDVCAVTPADGAVATPLEMLTGSSSASLEAAGIPPPKTARRKILDDARFGARLDDGTPATAFRSIGVGVVDLTTPESDPGESRKAPASARTTPGASPLASPTKRARQAGIKAFLTPKKTAATASAAGTPAAEVVDLVDSDDTP